MGLMVRCTRSGQWGEGGHRMQRPCLTHPIRSFQMAVVDGQDPKGQCSDEGAASCGRDGVCNGAGACRFYDSSAQCAPASCVDGVATSTRTCDGAGACQAARSSSCSAFMVVIKSSGSSAAVMKSKSMRPNVALLNANTNDPGLASGVIPTLDVNGFTLASDATVNGAGFTYHWVAWAAGPALKVGTYQGTGGSLSVTGLGFRPAWVWTIRADKAGIVERMPGHSQAFGVYGNVFNGSITSFAADGFALGSSGVANSEGSLHHYIAWADAAGRAKMGSYAGEGSEPGRRRLRLCRLRALT